MEIRERTKKLQREGGREERGDGREVRKVRRVMGEREVKKKK